MKKQISLLLMLLNISAFLLSPISAYAGSQPIADDQNIDTIDASNLDSAKTTEYQYDDLYRLTRASSTNAVYGGDYLQTYAYNAIGNITNKSDQGNYGYEGNTGTRYENPHAATSIGGASYVYDNNGNLLSDGTWTHSWDYDNRLIQSTNGTTTIGYTYDHGGNRLTYSDGIATTTYVNKYFSVSTTGTTTKNIFLGDQLIATVEGNGIATSTYYIHTDHLSGSNVITDEAGQVEQLIDYYPFGDMRINEKLGSFDEKRKFTSYTFDADTNLNYAGVRYQSGNIGKFISIDPVYLAVGDDNKLKEKTELELSKYLENPQNLNSYSYTIDNPLKHVDQKGEWFDTIVDAGFIGYDLYKIGQAVFTGGDVKEEAKSLGLDIAGAALPGVTGLGMVARTARVADKIGDAGKALKGVSFIQKYGSNIGLKMNEVSKFFQKQNIDATEHAIFRTVERLPRGITAEKVADTYKTGIKYFDTQYNNISYFKNGIRIAVDKFNQIRTVVTQNKIDPTRFKLIK